MEARRKECSPEAAEYAVSERCEIRSQLIAFEKDDHGSIPQQHNAVVIIPAALVWESFGTMAVFVGTFLTAGFSAGGTSTESLLL